MNNTKDKYIVASDVGKRDGIGIEYYRNDELLVEVFRDDTKKTREITLYKQDVPLDLVEKAIEVFKDRIQWEYQD